MAAHGYVVFSPNYRGSGNLGNAYQRYLERCGRRSGSRRHGRIDALKKLGFIDENKIGGRAGPTADT
jgi:dipeptidyl aminopeptidase/acylaminoacyl peptidase